MPKALSDERMRGPWTRPKDLASHPSFPNLAPRLMKSPAGLDEEDMSREWPTILLAEDHDGLREALVTLLESAGFRVLAASQDGAGLLRVAETTEPDVVLVDMRMPAVSGIDVARWMK